MALSELPINHIRRNGKIAETPPDSSSEDNLCPQTPSNAAKASRIPTPSSVQTMLRNTTEIGDIGQLAIRSRGPRKLRIDDSLPHLVHQTPAPRSSGSLHSSVRKQHYKGTAYGRSPASGGAPHVSLRPQPGTVSGASSIYSMYRNRSDTSFHSQSRVPSRAPSRGPSRGPESTDEPSYFTVQHSGHDRHVAAHLAHPNFQPRRQAAPQHMRPKSPYAYPTRLKRPGYRPSSPAVSEAYKYGSRHPCGFSPATAYHGTSLRTVSPLLIYSIETSPTEWRHGPNRSDPSVNSQHLLSRQKYGYSQYYQDLHSGRIVPSRTANRTQILEPPEMYRSTDSVPTTEAASPPLFYDYSEDFQQESLHHASDSTRFSERQQISSNRNSNRKSYYELNTDYEQCYETYIAELPADIPSSREASIRDARFKNVRADGPEPIGHGLERLSHTFSLREAEARSSTPAFQPAYQSSKISSQPRPITEESSPAGTADNVMADTQEITPASEAHPATGILDGDTDRQGQLAWGAPRATSAPRDTLGHRMLSSHKRSQEFLAGGPNRTIRNADISLYSRRSPSSPSSAVSMCSVKSISILGQEREPEADPGPAEASHQMQAENAPAKVYVQKLLSDAKQTITPRTARAEIYAPIPERSTSSPSHRQRFSSILSIEEDGLALDQHTGRSRQHARATLTGTFTKASDASNSLKPSDSPPPAHFPSLVLHENSEVQAPLANNEYHNLLPNSASKNPLVERRYQEWTSYNAKVESKHLSASANPLSGSLPGKALSMSESAINLLNLPAGADAGSPKNAKPNLPSEVVGTGEQFRKLDIMKELPPRPRSSIVSFAPPRQFDSVALPFAFTALRPEERESETDSVAELGRLAASYLNQSGRPDSDSSRTPPKMGLKMWSDRTSLVSSLRSTSGEVDIERELAEPPPHWALVTPIPAEELINPAPGKGPPFKLNVHRASSSTARTIKLTKHSPSLKAKTRPSQESITVRAQMSLNFVFSSLTTFTFAVARKHFSKSKTVL